jgi:hypothetical protein
MDVQTAQLRQQIEQTRAEMGATLDLLEWHVSRRVVATLEQAVISPVRSVQAAVARDTSALQRAPWLVMAAGGLLGRAAQLAYHFLSALFPFFLIGAVIVLLTWMDVTGLSLLVGGEVNSEIAQAAPSGKDPGEKQPSAP